MSTIKTLDTAAPDYIVDVEFDSETLELSMSVQALSILTGSNLLLRFQNLPAGWSPMVEFSNNDGHTIIANGPFEQVVVGRNQVLAVNAQSDTSQFHFRTLIQRGFGEYSDHNAAVIFSHWLPFALKRKSEQERLVEVKVLPDGENLRVEPLQITIEGGMRVIWDFSEVAKEYHQPLVVYGRPLLEQPPIDSQEFFGPHESFVYRGNTQVEGNGNNGTKGIYRYGVYLIDIRTRAISVRSSGDPQTDNEGEIRSSN
ncbi:hypothetical protein [Microbulbifer spongiae]|uniref:Uncharacterized protein n=1 Tax=Microbulbifer spongiae TaxID=2944933 RepID=A0ABY9EEX1_9GAMM|nr:hypothetical protein [Microbulbifer sp. MI-G]WKD50792.1 hypothetical protein M8T91_05035 [Microbulbifer sp. MI-G]